MTNRNKNKNSFDVLSPYCWGLHCFIERDQGCTFMTTFFEDVLSVWFHFSGLVWIDKLHYLDWRICFPNNGCLGNRKKTIFQLSWHWLLRRKKASSKTWILQIQYEWKNWVDRISASWDKKSQPQKCTFLKK